MYKLVFTHQAQKDARKLAASNLKMKAAAILEILKINPMTEYPPFEKLVGDLAGANSRRINLQHRIVYQVYEAEKTVKVIRMWTHYE